MHIDATLLHRHLHGIRRKAGFEGHHDLCKGCIFMNSEFPDADLSVRIVMIVIHEYDRLMSQFESSVCHEIIIGAQTHQGARA